MQLLKVKDLIAYLQKQDPEARILRIESNTGNWQSVDDHMIHTVAEDKKMHLEYVMNWYRTTDPTNKKVVKEMENMFRYCDDRDVVLAV